MKKRYVYIVVAFAFLLFSSVSVAQEKVIKIAFAGPMTGDSGVFGRDITSGMELAIKEVNDAGGIQKGSLKGYKFKMIGHLDDKSDPKEAANIAQKLCGEKDLAAVFGHVNSSCTLSALPIYAKCGMPVINQYSSHPKVTKSGYPNVVRLIDDENQGALIARIIYQKLKKKTAAAFYENTDYGVLLRDSFVRECEKLGLKAVAIESYIAGQDKDFSVSLTKIKGLNPEGLALLGVYTEAGIICRQARAMGVQASIVTTTSANTPVYIELAGKEAAEGSILSVLFNPDSKDPKVVRFGEAYRKMWKYSPAESSCVAYDSVYVLKDAIERGGATSKETLMKHLRATKDYPAITGNLTFNESGEPIGKFPSMLTVKDGKFVELVL